MRQAALVVISIIAVWLAVIVTDYSLARADRPPVFAIAFKSCDDGGSTEYYGAGYKVIKYVSLCVDRGVQVEAVTFGSWLMDFSLRSN